MQEAENLAEVLEEQAHASEEQENAPEEEQARNQAAAARERELAPGRQVNAPEKKADVSKAPVILPKGRANVPDVPVMAPDGPDGAFGEDEKEVRKPKNGPAFEITQESLEKITAKFKDGTEEELYSLEFSEEARKAREEHEKEEDSEASGAEDSKQPEDVPNERNEVPNERNEVPNEQNEVPNERNKDDLDDSKFEEADGTVEEFPKGYNPAEQNEIPAEQNEIPTEQNEIPAEQNEVPAEQNEVPAEQKDVPAEQNEIPAEQNGVPAEQNGVPAEQNEIPAEQNEIPAEQKDVPKEQNLAPEVSDVSPMKDEVPKAEEIVQAEVPARPEEAAAPEQKEAVSNAAEQPENANAAEQPNVPKASGVEGGEQPNVSEETNSDPVNGTLEIKATETNTERTESLPEQIKSDVQQPVDDIDADRSTTNNYNGQPAVDDDSEFEELESEENEDDLEELESYSGNDGAEKGDMVGDRAGVTESDDQPAASEAPDTGKTESEQGGYGVWGFIKNYLGFGGQPAPKTEETNAQERSADGGLGSAASGTQQTEKKPANDTVPDHTGDVYAEDGEQFTEVEEDPELLLEDAQDSAVKRIQKRIEALQADILKNEDQNQVVDEMGLLMECMMMIGAVREIKLTEDGKVTCSRSELNGKTPEYVSEYLDSLYTENGKTAEKEHASALGKDPVLRSMLQKNGGDIVKNARSMVGNGNLVRTYQNYLQQNALAHTGKANAESAPTKKNGKNLNNSI